jgi:Fe-S-cluster-containing dehydrogenase component
LKLKDQELAYVRSQGLYITEKCDGCGKLLNQGFRYTIAGKPEVYCSAACRDLAFFGDRQEAKKHTTPGKCVYCGGTLEGKRRGALYCDEICKKRAARTGRAQSTAEPEITGIPPQSNQRVAYAKNADQGNRTTGLPQPCKRQRKRSEGRYIFRYSPLPAKVVHREASPATGQPGGLSV